MSDLYDLVSSGLCNIIERACNDEKATDLSHLAFWPLVQMNDMMHLGNMNLDIQDFAHRCILLVTHSCQIMNTHDSGFDDSELRNISVGFIKLVADELNVDDNLRTCWLSMVNEKLPV